MVTAFCYFLRIAHGAMMATIHVYLPNEAAAVWAPVEAEHVHDNVYRIIDCRGEDDEVQFGKGALVRCRPQRRSGDFGVVEDVLIAYEEVAEI
jgi:hypothetical protein